jgi:hypothetical protein
MRKGGTVYPPLSSRGQFQEKFVTYRVSPLFVCDWILTQTLNPKHTVRRSLEGKRRSEGDRLEGALCIWPLSEAESGKYFSR